MTKYAPKVNLIEFGRHLRHRDRDLVSPVKEILANAIDACRQSQLQKPDAAVQVIVECDPYTHRVWVRDNGSGVEDFHAVLSVGYSTKLGHSTQLIGRKGSGLKAILPFANSLLVRSRGCALSWKRQDPDYDLSNGDTPAEGTELEIEADKESAEQLCSPEHWKSVIQREMPYVSIPIYVCGEQMTVSPPWATTPTAREDEISVFCLDFQDVSGRFAIPKRPVDGGDLALFSFGVRLTNNNTVGLGLRPEVLDFIRGEVDCRNIEPVLLRNAVAPNAASRRAATLIKQGLINHFNYLATYEAKRLAQIAESFRKPLIKAILNDTDFESLAHYPFLSTNCGRRTVGEILSLGHKAGNRLIYTTKADAPTQDYELGAAAGQTVVFCRDSAEEALLEKTARTSQIRLTSLSESVLVVPDEAQADLVAELTSLFASAAREADVKLEIKAFDPNTVPCVVRALDCDDLAAGDEDIDARVYFQCSLSTLTVNCRSQNTWERLRRLPAAIQSDIAVLMTAIAKSHAGLADADDYRRSWTALISLVERLNAS